MTSPQRIIANQLIREQPRYHIGVLSWPQCVEVIAANIVAALIDAGHLPAPETHTRYMNNRGDLYRSVGYGPWELISPADVPSAQDALPIGDPA